jgi:Mce-associated membrane protein
MTEAEKPPEDSVRSKAEAMALLEEAEAEAAEAEALAAAARARARAARLRREALAEAEAKAEAAEAAEAEAKTAEATQAAETVEVTQADDTAEAAKVTQAGDSDEDADEEAAEETIEAVEIKPRDGRFGSPESRPSRWRRRLPSLSATLKGAAIVLICAFAGISGYMAWQDHEATEREQRAANFVAGARQGIVNMTSLDFNRANEDVRRLLDSSTGQFRDDFQQRAKDFTSVVEQSKVVSQGTVTAAALESMKEHSASVLVSVTSRISNSAGAKDEPRRFRFRVTVTEEGGQYKMSKVDFVP